MPRERKPFRAPDLGQMNGSELGLRRTPGLLVTTATAAVDGKVTPEDIQRWGALLHPDEMRFLRVLAKGYDVEDCAALVGRDPADGAGIRARLLGMTAGYAFFRQQTSHMLSSLTGRAINALGEALDSSDGRVRMMAVRTVFEATAFFGSRADAADAAARSAGVETAPVTAEAMAEQTRAMREEIARLDALAEQVRLGMVVEGEAVDVTGEAETEAPPTPPMPWD